MLARQIEWTNKIMDDKQYVEDLTLDNIMGEDYTPYLAKNKTFGYDLYVEDESGVERVMRGIHPCAIESLAHFCRRFLQFYNKEVN